MRKKNRRNYIRKIARRRKKEGRSASKTNTVMKGLGRVVMMTPRDVQKPKTVTCESGSRGIRQAAWRCRKTLPRDTEKRIEVINELCRMEKIQSRRELVYPSSSLTKEVLKMAKFGAKRKVDRVAKIASGIMKKYKSLRAAHRSFGSLTWKRWHSICKPKKELHSLRRITQVEKNEIIALWESPEVSITLPFKKHAKKRFMIVTISQAYQKYIRKQKNRNKQVTKQSEKCRILSISSFYKLKPKYVKTRRSLPLNLCTCGKCSNFSLKRDALLVHNIKGVSKRATIAACEMLCPIKTNKDVMDIADYNRECIYKTCKNCTPKKIIAKIKEQNPDTNWQKEVTWHKWKNIKKIVNGKECSAFEKVQHKGTLDELLVAYTNDSKLMPLHMLNMDWQRSMYCKNRDVLKKGDVQLVIDYGKNYAHTAQNEPQSAHWDRKQSTLHPIAATFPCPEPECYETVTNEIVCISPDLTHDYHGVELFVEKTIEMLKKNGVPVKRIYEWSDNCYGQYKSKYTFEKISQSQMPRMRSFYGESHGKSAADGIIGRLKMEIDSVVKVGQDIQCPEALYNYCKNKMETANAAGCQHFRKNFLYFPTIPRPPTEEDVSSVQRITKQHCIRSTGKKGILEVRELTCFCKGCMKGNACVNSPLVQPWEKINFKNVNDKRNTHWPENTSKKEKMEGKENKIPKGKLWKGLPEKPQQCSSRSSHPPPPQQNWTQIGQKLMQCKTYRQLTKEVDKVTLATQIEKNIEPFELPSIAIDDISVGLYPDDGPRNCKPISVYGDGNCFTRCLSLICYGTQDRHLEMRARLCVEGVMNRQFYLDNDYLNLEGKFFGDLTEYLAIVSEHYNSVPTSNWNRSVIEKIYDCEVLGLSKPGQYCSMWQVYQAANVLGRPIFSVHPQGMIDEYRSRTHRLVFPIRQCLRDLDPVCIMWTKCSLRSQVMNHFVPVVRM